MTTEMIEGFLFGLSIIGLLGACYYSVKYRDETDKKIHHLYKNNTTLQNEQICLEQKLLLSEKLITNNAIGEGQRIRINLNRQHYLIAELGSYRILCNDLKKAVNEYHIQGKQMEDQIEQYNAILLSSQAKEKKYRETIQLYSKKITRLENEKRDIQGSADVYKKFRDELREEIEERDKVIEKIEEEKAWYYRKMQKLTRAFEDASTEDRRKYDLLQSNFDSLLEECYKLKSKPKKRTYKKRSK